MNKKYQKSLLILIIVIMIIILAGATFAYLSVNVIKIGNDNVEISTKDIDIFEIKKISDANIDANMYNFGPNNGENQTSSAEISVSLKTSKDTSTFCYNVNLLLPPQQRNIFDNRVNEYVLNNKNKTQEEITNELENNICNFNGDYTISNELKELFCSTDNKNFNNTLCSNEEITIDSSMIDNLQNDYCNSLFDYNSSDNTPEFVLNVYKSINNGSYIKVIDNMDITTNKGILNIPVSINSSTYKNKITASEDNAQIETWKAEVTLVWLEDYFQDSLKGKNYQAYLEVNHVDC